MILDENHQNLVLSISKILKYSFPEQPASTSFIRFCNPKEKLTSVKMTQSINAVVAFVVATAFCASIVELFHEVSALSRQNRLQLQIPR